MPNILDVLTGGSPLGELATKALDILGRFIPDPGQKAAAALELTKAQTAAELQLGQQLLELQSKQADVITAEVKSESWLAANWRPVLMLTFTFVIAWNYIVCPIVGAFTPALHPAIITADMWQLLKLGIGGYIGGRTVEKIAKQAPGIVAAVKGSSSSSAA